MSRNTVRSLIAVLVILLACLLSSSPYVLDGKSIYHVTSLAASPIYYLKLQIDRFQHLDFYPQYWSSQVFTGGPIHTGLGIYNPLLLLVAGCSSLSHSLILYDIVLKFIAGVGLYLLLRRFKFSIPISLCCSLIFPFNPFYGVYGQDPQFASPLCFIPYLILLIDLIAEKRNEPLPALQFSLLLALVLALTYLCGNIQMQWFLLLFILFPITLLQTYLFLLRKKGQDLDTTGRISNPVWIPLFFFGLAIALSLLLTLFELIPTWNVLRMGDRPIPLSYHFKQVFYFLCLTFGSFFALHFFLKRAGTVRPALLIVPLAVILVFSQGIETPHTLFIKNYLHPISEIDYFSSMQGKIKYYFTVLQVLVFLGGVFFLFRGGTATRDIERKSEGKQGISPGVLLQARRWIPICLALSYFAINFGLTLFPRVGMPHYERFAFIPLPGIMIGIACGLEKMGEVLGPTGFRHVALFFLVLLPIENYHVFSQRTLFTTDIAQLDRVSEEYSFLRSLRSTERVIDTYEDQHKQWRQAFNPELLPIWLMPVYYGAHTFSRVGIGVIPRQNAEYNHLAMPRYFGVDRDKPQTPLLNLAGVKYIFALRPLPQQENLNLLKKGEEYYIYENPEALPRVFLYPKALTLPEGEILQVLAAKSREELLRDVYLRDGDIVDLRNGGNQQIYQMSDTLFESSLGKVVVKTYGEEQIEIACQIEEDALFMMTDTYVEEGWRAYIGDEERPILRADHIFRAVKLPPGDYTLRMRYESDSNRLGLHLSAAVLVLIVSLLLATRIYHHRRRTITSH